MTDIVELLVAWGKSQRLNEAPNGYPKQTNFARNIRSTGKATVKLPPLGIDRHMRVDAAVSELKQRHPDEHAIICMAYIDNQHDQQICRKLRKSRSTVRDSRKRAEYWLEARLI